MKKGMYRLCVLIVYRVWQMFLDFCQI